MDSKEKELVRAARLNISTGSGADKRQTATCRSGIITGTANQNIESWSRALVQKYKAAFGAWTARMRENEILDEIGKKVAENREKARQAAHVEARQKKFKVHSPDDTPIQGTDSKIRIWIDEAEQDLTWDDQASACLHEKAYVMPHPDYALGRLWCPDCKEWV